MPEIGSKKKGSKIWLLVNLFGLCWSEAYGGEVYEKTPRDMQSARIYLENNEGMYDPSSIAARARFYLRSNGYYAEQRHSFHIFINNINSFAPPKSAPVKLWQCPQCQASMPESKQYNHPEQCPNWNKQSPEEINSMVEGLSKKWGAK